MKKTILDPTLFKDKVKENAYEALQKLVENSYYGQLAPRDFSRGPGFLEEFCTVKMASARGTGHSYSAVKLGMDYFNSALFISPKIDMSRRLMGNFAECYKEANYKIVTEDPYWDKVKLNVRRIETQTGNYYFEAADTFDSFARGIKTEAIIVDVACMFSQAKIDNIYEVCHPCMNHLDLKFFIFIE